MRKYSDDEIKRLFKIEKNLMLWPHPEKNKHILEKDFRHVQRVQDPEFLNASEEELRSYALELKAYLDNFPLSVYIETTNVCNLKCVMCPHENQ